MRLAKEISIIESLNSRQTDQLVMLYREEFWCNKRKSIDVQKMLANSNIIIGAVDKSNNLVGFVRVLTDFVYKATVYDLIVHKKWRGNKISNLLMDTVINHPELRNVEHFDLNCLPEMYPFYEKWGFTSEVGKLGFMRRLNCKL